MTTKPQYSLDNRHTTLFLHIVSELLMRVKGGPSRLEDSIHMSTAHIGGGVVARFYGLPSNRKAWIVPAHDENKTLLVWFSDEGVGGEFQSDITFCKSQDNVIPNHMACHSAFYLTIGGALDAIENHIINNKLPDAPMPPGYLQHLVG